MTRDWQRARLGDVLSIKHGFAFKSEYFADNGPYVVTTPGNFHDAGGFKFSEEKRKGYDGPIPDGYILQEDDLLVAMTEQAEGLLGSTALVPVSGVFLHNQRLGLIRVNDPRHTEKRFIYYLFNSAAVRQLIRASASGTKVRHTSPSRIGEMVVSLPPFAEQARIASILSAYDDLIENITRRIANLEEMARRIFEEWFVHFRAPGCDGLQMVDSAIGPVPQAWEVKALGEILDFKYGKALKADNRRAGPFPVYGSSGVVGEHDVALVTGPGIVVGRKGNVGSVHWSERSFFPIDTAFFVTSKLPLVYVYHLLRIQRFLNSDAAVPGLNRAQALAIQVAVPPGEFRARFSECVEPSFRLIENFVNQNANLRAQRDLLLPKLISGEIDITAASASIKEAAE